jgi:hypothetical protein
LWWHVRFPLSPRNIEDLLHECGVGNSHKTAPIWRHLFGPMFAEESASDGHVAAARARLMASYPPSAHMSAGAGTFQLGAVMAANEVHNLSSVTLKGLSTKSTLYLA